MSAFGRCSAGREDDTHLQPGWHRLMTDGFPGKPEAVRGPPDSNLPYREISRYGGREIPARATFGAQLVNKQLTETRHDAEIRQDSRRVCGGPHARCRLHSHQGRSSRPPYSPCSSHPPCSQVYAPPPPPCCQVYAPPPPPPCCVYGGGYGDGYGYGGGYGAGYGAGYGGDYGSYGGGYAAGYGGVYDGYGGVSYGAR